VALVKESQRAKDLFMRGKLKVAETSASRKSSASERTG